MRRFWSPRTSRTAIRTAISVGGDSDTLAAITGAIAGVYYGIPQHIARTVFDKLDPRLQGILNEFERAWVLQSTGLHDQNRPIFIDKTAPKCYDKSTGKAILERGC